MMENKLVELLESVACFAKYRPYCDDPYLVELGNEASDCLSNLLVAAVTEKLAEKSSD